MSAHELLNLTLCVDFNNSNVNDSCDKFKDDTDFIDESPTLFLLIYRPVRYTICTLAVILNILNIIALANAPSKLTPHLKLVISLAISDVCIVLPFILILSVFKPRENWWCLYTTLFSYFQPSIFLVSLLNLLALGIDHYIAIVKPLQYNIIVTNSRTNVLMCVIWIASFITSVFESLPHVLMYNTINGSNNTFCQYMLQEYFPKTFYLLIIPELIVLIILYVQVYVAYKKYVIRHQSLRPDYHHNKKAIATTLLVIGTFMVCYLPVSVLQIASYLFMEELMDVYIKYKGLIHYMTQGLVLLNPLCDALLYALRLTVVKEGYKEIFRSLCKRHRKCLQTHSTMEGVQE